MSELDDRERTLVGLGAALASNCGPCIEYHIPNARRAGLSGAQITEAIRIADKVRRVPARLVLQTAMARIDEAGDDLVAQEGPGCGCAASRGSDCVG